MENRKHLPDFHLPFCWLFGKWDVENRTQLADFHLPFCGCFKLTSCTVITTLVWATRSHSQCGDLQLHWKLELNVDQINCTTVRITLQLCFWILQNEVQVSFFMSLWSWVLLPLCNMLNISLRRKLEYPQSPPTILDSEMPSPNSNITSSIV